MGVIAYPSQLTLMFWTEDRLLWLARMIGLVGFGALVWSGGERITWGAVLVVAACACWAIDNNLTQKVSAANPLHIALRSSLESPANPIGRGR